MGLPRVAKNFSFYWKVSYKRKAHEVLDSVKIYTFTACLLLKIRIFNFQNAIAFNSMNFLQ